MYHAVTRHYESIILVVDKGGTWDTTHTRLLRCRAEYCHDHWCRSWSCDLPIHYRGHPGCYLL